MQIKTITTDVLVQAATAAYHRLGDLVTMEIISHSFGGWNFEIRMPAQGKSVDGGLQDWR